MNPRPLKTLFIVPPEVHLLDISGPAHVFYEAIQYEANIDLSFASLTSDKERTSAGLCFSDLNLYADSTLVEGDIIFIPGLEVKLIYDDDFQIASKPFFIWLNHQINNGVKICSVCTGAYLLGFSGVLDGRQCTTHWKYLNDFKQRFPKAKLYNDRLFVKDDPIYSSAGVSSGIDLALFILEELYGPIFATKIAKEIVVYLRRAEDDPQLSVFLKYRNHIENRIHLIQDHLAQHLNQKHKIEDLAKRVNMSPRNLTRLFKKTTGLTIGEYHDELRIERAIQLLTDGQKVDVVSHACGITSNQLRSILKKNENLLPSNLS